MYADWTRLDWSGLDLYLHTVPGRAAPGRGRDGDVDVDVEARTGSLKSRPRVKEVASCVDPRAFLEMTWLVRRALAGPHMVKATGLRCKNKINMEIFSDIYIPFVIIFNMNIEIQ